MEFLVLLVLILSSTFCYADCYQNFSLGGDSASHQVNVSDAAETDDLAASAKFAIQKLSKKYDCKDIYIRELRCRYLAKDQAETHVCYARTDIGYFIVNKDYMENINLIFNRFD